ncbi:uncharacterized protein LOC122530109 [Frieseomelitta varia]|uniref:uncharacterized protein LOC122530109 n=1 Tax=Frieseomelitta varia TaxID=561572 RepID=UPI001CB67EDD|nr:uncharacterized protein LOC122530109 [Frieseomelitta varia]
MRKRQPTVEVLVVYKRRALWDQKDRNHHNRYILDKLWEEVATELHSTSKEIRNKWKNLRDKFRIEMYKKIKPKSDDGTGEYIENLDENQQINEAEVSSWQYFKPLLFLKDQFTPRENKGNKNLTSQKATSPAPVDPATLDPNESLFEDSSPSPSPSVASCSSSHKKRSKRPHNHLSDIGSKLVELEKKKLKLLAEDQNEDIRFFESLIPHIKKLSDEKRMLLMMDIQQVVYRHVYSTPQTPSPFSPLQGHTVY